MRVLHDRKPTCPTVLFAAHWRWHSFDMLAAALRRRGVRVVLLTESSRSARGRLRHAMQRLVYHEVHAELSGCSDPVAALDLDEDGEALRRAVLRCGPGLVGLECEEPLRRRAAEVLGAEVMQRLISRAGSAAGADALYDKHALAIVAEEAGVPAPAWWEEQDGPKTYPAVVKVRTGFGGRGVRRVDTPDELAAAVASLGGPGAVVVQEHLAGEAINAAGVALAGNLQVLVTYRVQPSSADPYGAPAIVVPDDDLAVQTATTTLIATLGYTGMFSVNLLRDCEGTPRLVDFNPRVFGSWWALQRAGVDLLAAYCALLDPDASTSSTIERPISREPVAVFPMSLAGLAQADLPRATHALLLQLADLRLFFGNRWALLAGKQVGAELVRARLSHRARTRPRVTTGSS